MFSDLVEEVRWMFEDGGRKRSQQTKTYAKMAPFDTGKKAQRRTVQATGDIGSTERRAREGALGKRLAARGKSERGYASTPLAKGTYARGDLKTKSREGNWGRAGARTSKGTRQRSPYSKGRPLPIPGPGPGQKESSSFLGNFVEEVRWLFEKRTKAQQRAGAVAMAARAKVQGATPSQTDTARA